MNKFDQTKMLLKARKIQKELSKKVITIEKGNGAVKVEINGEQKIKKIKLDRDLINFDDLEDLEIWLEEAVRDAVSESQKLAAAEMQPMMGALSSLGF